MQENKNKVKELQEKLNKKTITTTNIVIKLKTKMYTSNNQVIFEEIYDENIQATEEEIAEYAIFLGIEPNDVILNFCFRMCYIFHL